MSLRDCEAVVAILQPVKMRLLRRFTPRKDRPVHCLCTGGEADPRGNLSFSSPLNFDL
jgi:hypothetical protein